MTEAPGLTISVRPELPGDTPALDALLQAAFEGTDEASLVRQLRDGRWAEVALVAEVAGELAGYVLFSPLDVDGIAEGQVMALAPLAVAPGLQGRGVGGTLVHSGLDACRDQGASAVVVLGDPDYYGRFGFGPAAAFALRCPWPAPPSAWQALELAPGALSGAEGELRYAPPFRQPGADI